MFMDFGKAKSNKISSCEEKSARSGLTFYNYIFPPLDDQNHQVDNICIDLYPRYRYNNRENIIMKHEKTLTNLKKARTHIDKVIKMIENGEYCINVMQQNLAVIGLLKSAHQMLMEGHLNSCFKNAMKTNNEVRKQEMIDEILKVSKLANK